MGRGKIEIKRIENLTNRQVTYSKRRTGIVKKARELTVLCDAEVSLIVFSSTGKLSEFVSPSTTMKKVFDQYQQISGTNLWSSHYELRNLQETHSNLLREFETRRAEDPYYNEAEYESLVRMGNIGADIYSFLPQAGQAPNLPDAGDFGHYNLRLA
ncbi:hypothetical protein Syun_015600 [Stephania yunnanensis]|uniref:MADS-box domain-containing protein n=1 Tax=Stephania yunnanensis TaxID=152371 RepID=A0AAP0PD42_9MAGN